MVAASRSSFNISLEICALTVSHYYPIQPSQQLMYALECGDYNHIITWSFVDRGLSFFILDTSAFAKHVLPALFKEAKFDSFQRKLYRWGFVKNKRSMRGNKTVLSFSHPYFRKGDFELASKVTCSGPGSASNRITSAFPSPPGSNVFLRTTGKNYMVGAKYTSATEGYQDMEVRNTNSSPTFVDGVRATVPADVLGQQRRRVLGESSLSLRRDPVLLPMFGNGGGMKRSSGGVIGRLSAAESNPRFYQAPCHHHDPCHHSADLQNRNTGMDGQQIMTLSSSFSTNPFQQRVRCPLPGMDDSLHRPQQTPSLRRIATPRQEERFSSGAVLSMQDQQSIIQDALDVLQLA